MVFEVCEQIVAGNFSGNATELVAQCPFANAVAGGMMGVLIAAGFALAALVILAFYVYTSLAWYTIANKLKYKNAWLAWIPIVRWAMVLQLGKFHWAWIFLIFIPIFGWIALFVMLIISTWRIYEQRKYPGWFSLAPIIPELGGLLVLIIIGFVAWKDRKKMLFG
jgi:uncharacterized membrane protein YciS (DUF1049 family)